MPSSPASRSPWRSSTRVSAEGRLAIKQARPWVFDEAGGEPTAPSPTPLPSPTPPQPTPTVPQRYDAYVPLLMQAAP